MLYHAFSHFGEVERAVHIVDEKGRPTGEGIVEFERKNNCAEAIAAIREKVFLLTSNPKPLIAEPLEPKDEDDGLAERMIPRTAHLIKEREMGPRFPSPNSFEFVYGQKWKDLYEMEKQRRAALEDELKEARKRLEQDMELAYQDYQAQMLREDLQRRQQELERLEAARRERMAMRPPAIPPQMGGPPGPGPFGDIGPFGGPPMGGGGGPPNFQQMPPGPGNPFSGGGPPMNMNQSMPPPQHQNGPGPGGPRPGPGGQNMLEGVQRLLQIFKSDSGGPGPGPNHMQMPPNQPRGMPPGPGMFGGGPGPNPYDQPPEKRFRR
ncbi:hypothetical protein WR25_19825 [Diploscapter pachys]|uniref:RRM domain-containing protein n=1 Tax=Diploscapter pachys TaxID=2018661 RepID=A0A2A2LAG6_9BILA|nr:hypothetical protein WR25_19825 [Diploscapter pachys]